MFQIFPSKETKVYKEQGWHLHILSFWFGPWKYMLKKALGLGDPQDRACAPVEIHHLHLRLLFSK